MAVVGSGRPARTGYEVSASWATPEVSLVTCTLETGRTHQIRVHLAHAGFPLAVDPLYGRRDAFMLSEIQRAFEIGFLIALPFLIIDLVVAAILMSMGMMMLPPVLISLPFKVIFFVLIDGWYMLAGSLMESYVPVTGG